MQAGHSMLGCKSDSEVIHRRQKALLLTPLCSTEPPLLSPLPGGDFLFSSMLRVIRLDSGQRIIMYQLLNQRSN